MLDKHPKLNVTLVHLFFLHEDIDKAKRVLEKYSNVKYDLTPGCEMYIAFSEKIEEWHDFFVTYTDRNSTVSFEHCNNIQKLVWNVISHYYSEFKMPCYSDNMIKSLNLNEQQLKKICFENCQRFVGEKKQVDEAKFVLSCEKMIDALQKKGGFDSYIDVEYEGTGGCIEGMKKVWNF